MYFFFYIQNSTNFKYFPYPGGNFRDVDESRCYVSSIPGAAGLLAVMAWAMSARVLGPLMERETCTGTLRGLSEEGPAAGAGPDPGRGNPEGLEPMPARAYM